MTKPEAIQKLVLIEVEVEQITALFGPHDRVHPDFEPQARSLMRDLKEKLDAEYGRMSGRQWSESASDIEQHF
jgi:hypothetical protein